jgi:DNA repair protein RadC
LENFEPHEVLELLLCYAIPLRDVKPIAHRLIIKFGSVRGTLLAPREELTQVSGIGESAARFLFEVRGAMEEYLGSFPAARPVFAGLGETVANCRALFGGLQRETRGAACLDAEGCLINMAMLGDFNDIAEALRRAAGAALRHRAFSVVIIQYTPFEKNCFSREDIEFTRVFADSMAALKIATLDHVLIHNNGHASLRAMGFLRETAFAPGEQTELSLRWLDN